MDEPLEAPESGAIALDRPSLESYLEVEFVRPEEVDTLRAWGKMTLTAGKHKTNAFAEAAFETDLDYAVVMSRSQLGNLTQEVLPRPPEGRSKGRAAEQMADHQIGRCRPRVGWKLCLSGE